MTGADSPLSGLSGAVLADKYRLVSLLGRGGMGYVYQAEQLGLGRSVAVKLLRRDLIATRFEWFRAEAMAASRINHPHAVAIYDFGLSENGVPYLVMEHLRGETLTSRIEGDRLSVEQIATIAAQVLSALAEAHACGVVHCDLTGENVIVERLRDGGDFAKVIDFGLARLFEDPQSEGRTLGTAEYMAPEQVRGSVISPKTDLYAVGILVYEMLVGRTPFAGASVPVILEGHLHAEPDALDRIIPSCPSELAAVIARALEKDPERRPQSAAAMREQILAAVPAAPRSPTTRTSPDPAGPPAIRRPAAAIRRTGPMEPPPPPRRSTRLTLELAPERQAGPLIGRKVELARLLSFCRGEDETPKPALALLGPRGIGKARLITEAARRAESRFFLAAPDPSGLATPWYPILGLLEQSLNLEAPGSFDELARAAARCGLPERDVPGLAEIFSLPSPAQSLELAVRRREAHASAIRALLAVHRRHPRGVLCFVDLDQFDAPSVRVVHELAARLSERGAPADVRVVLTATRRPDIAGLEVLDLAGLPPGEARDLAVALAGGDRAMPDEREINELTGGSPAAVEQLAGWVAMESCTAEMPSVLVDLISVRANRLPAAARRVLQAVAIQGTVAPRWAVEACLAEDEVGALEGFDWTGLLVVEEQEVALRSDLVAQVISACTPADVRRRLHFRALEALGEKCPVGVRGNHAELAGELGQAYSHYMRAGHDAVRRFDDSGAAAWYGRAVRVARELHARGVPNAAGELIDSSILLAEVLRYAGEPSLAIGVLDEAIPFSPDARQLAGIERQRSLSALMFDQPEAARDHLQAAIAAALRSGERNLLCQLYIELARVLDRLGKRQAAIEELTQAVDVITIGEGLKTVQGPERLWRLGKELAERLLEAGDLERAKEAALDSLAHARRVSWPQARGRLSAVLARICETAGEHEEALEHRTNAIEQMRSLGDRRSTAELLIESIRAAQKRDGASKDPAESDGAMDLAATLAAEIGWAEGVALTRRR